MIRAWVFALDAGGYVVSVRPFCMRHEASALALIWMDLGIDARMLTVAT